MGVLYSDVNYGLLLKDIETNCMTEEVCGACQHGQCLVGYAKQCITGSLKNKVTFVENGIEKIPHDMRAFEHDLALNAIAHILRQCKSCEEDHFDDCLVNVIRSCYEIMTLGEAQKYKGSVFLYLSAIQTDFPEEAAHIMQEFQANKG